MALYMNQPLDYNALCAKFGGRPLLIGSRYYWPAGVCTDETLMIVYSGDNSGIETLKNRRIYVEAKANEQEQSFYHYRQLWEDNPDRAPHDAVDRLKAMADTVRTLKADLAAVDAELAATPEGKALAEQKRLLEQAERERREQSSQRKHAIGSVTL